MHQNKLAQNLRKFFDLPFKRSSQFLMICRASAKRGGRVSSELAFLHGYFMGLDCTLAGGSLATVVSTEFCPEVSVQFNSV